jgi:hypothetical protein
MAKSNKSYQPLQVLGIKASEDIPANRFVGYDGAICNNESRAFGVTEVSWMNGEMISAISLGTAIIETSQAISIGQDVTSDDSGKGIPANPSSSVNGRALDTSAGAGFIRIKLVQ